MMAWHFTIFLALALATDDVVDRGRTGFSKRRMSLGCCVALTLRLLSSVRALEDVYGVADEVSEERPGHQVKLYEYCSGSVRDIVRRHGKVCAGSYSEDAWTD